MNTKKTLRWKEFAAMTPEEKLARWRQKPGKAVEPCWTKYLEHFQQRKREYEEKVKRYGYCDIDPELSQPEPTREDFERLIAVVGKFRNNRAIPSETLVYMKRFYGLVFGYRSRDTSEFEPGIMAIMDDVFGKFDGIEGLLVMGDFRGKTMEDLLTRIHNDGEKTVTSDFVERRIERLFLTPAEISLIHPD